MIDESISITPLPLHQLFYVSVARHPYDSDTVQSILRAAWRNNPSLGVTGCLLFSGNHFAQVLEGDRATLVVLATRIAADSRHQGFRLLAEGAASARAYGGFSMDYRYELDLEKDLARLLAKRSQPTELLTSVRTRMQP